MTDGIRISEPVRTSMGNYTFTVEISAVTSFLEKNFPALVMEKVREQVISTLAADYVDQHRAEILTSMNPTAVANLAIADAARGIREKLLDPKERK